MTKPAIFITDFYKFSYDIQKFLIKKQRPFIFFCKFVWKHVFVVYFQTRMFCLLIHIKYFVCIYFIENKIFAKRLFSNYGPSKMVCYFFKFFIFSCFRGTFVNNFMKIFHFLMQIFKIQFKIYYLPSFMISNQLLIKQRPFQSNTKFEKKSRIY